MTDSTTDYWWETTFWQMAYQIEYSVNAKEKSVVIGH